MIYPALFIALILQRLVLARRPRSRKQVYFIVLGVLFVFSAFRYQVGCDWSGYYYQYMRATYLDLTHVIETREPIWWAILSWLSQKGLPYPTINIVANAIFFLGINVLARRQPDPLGFLVLLYPILIINMPMSGIRQGAAIGLLSVALVAFIDRRPSWFAFWVVLAAGFHVSAIVFIMLLPVATGRYTRKRLLLAAVLAVPGIFFLTSGEAAEIANSRYVGTGLDADGAVFRVGILSLSAIFFFLLLRNKWKQLWPQDYSLVSTGSIGMLLIFLLIPMSTVIADRFSYYLIPIQGMIFARIPFLPFRTNAAIYAASPYIGLLLVFTVWTELSGHFNQCYIPYQSWIFGFPAGDPLGL